MSSDYPLSVMAADRLETATGRKLEDVTTSNIEALRAYIRTIPQIRNLRDLLTRGLLLVSQPVRFCSHTICPHQLIAPDGPLRLAEGGRRVLG